MAASSMNASLMAMLPTAGYGEIPFFWKAMTV
jgi:hypothetical protein